METVRVHLLISGRVQGVFFRSYTQEEAERLGLCGWVRNTYDGRVEAVLEGEKDKVDTMIKWCHHGPPSARVTKVEVNTQQPTGEFTGFEIRY